MKHGPALAECFLVPLKRDGRTESRSPRKTKKKTGKLFNKKRSFRSGARTRWVTERIASLSSGSLGKRSGIKRRNHGFE